MPIRRYRRFIEAFASLWSNKWGKVTASRRTSMTVADQPQVTYTYDNANRLTQVEQGTDTVPMGYDIAGRRTSLTLPNTNNLTYAYNAASELTTLTYKQGATTLEDLTCTYEAAGNRIKTGGTFAHTNLPPALASATYNANNQQTAFGTTTVCGKRCLTPFNSIFYGYSHLYKRATVAPNAAPKMPLMSWMISWSRFREKKLVGLVITLMTE
jgi:YD repeat-containing protein